MNNRKERDLLDYIKLKVKEKHYCTSNELKGRPLGDMVIAAGIVQFSVPCCNGQGWVIIMEDDRDLSFNKGTFYVHLSSQHHWNEFLRKNMLFYYHGRKILIKGVIMESRKIKRILPGVRQKIEEHVIISPTHDFKEYGIS